MSGDGNLQPWMAFVGPWQLTFLPDGPTHGSDLLLRRVLPSPESLDHWDALDLRLTGPNP